MSSTKEKLPKLPAYCLPSFWLALSLMLVATVLSFTDLLHFDKKRAESARQFEELSDHYRDEVLTLKIAQIDNLKEIKDRLIVLESAMKKIQPKEETTPLETDPSVSSQEDEFVGKLKSMSDEGYQAMVLEHVKASDRQLVEQHFKQENAFKASLKPAEKQKFDADVKKAYAKLLANCKVEGDLSSLQKEAIRRSAESMAIADWRVNDSIVESMARDDAWLAKRRELTEKRIRLRKEKHREMQIKSFGAEFVERMQEESE